MDLIKWLIYMKLKTCVFQWALVFLCGIGYTRINGQIKCLFAWCWNTKDIIVKFSLFFCDKIFFTPTSLTISLQPRINIWLLLWGERCLIIGLPVDWHKWTCLCVWNELVCLQGIEIDRKELIPMSLYFFCMALEYIRVHCEMGSSFYMELNTYVNEKYPYLFNIIIKINFIHLHNGLRAYKYIYLGSARKCPGVSFFF